MSLINVNLAVPELKACRYLSGLQDTTELGPANYCRLVHSCTHSKLHHGEKCCGWQEENFRKEVVLCIGACVWFECTVFRFIWISSLSLPFNFTRSSMAAGWMIAKLICYACQTGLKKALEVEQAIKLVGGWFCKGSIVSACLRLKLSHLATRSMFC